MRFSDQTETIDLDTSLGRIRGHVYAASNGKRIGRFLGIPYAQQPVGHLRFVPPRPLQLPLGTEGSPFEALKVAPAAPQNQKLTMRSQLPTSESCLYLNISCPLDNLDKPKPILFHIHGGAYYVFSAGELGYDVTHFAELHDAVGVSINYRLGVLGFFSMPPVIEDNLGIKDQQFALKWVHQHIKSFGGDESRITMFGYSAGAASIHMHLLNRESSALFDRAILSSGCMNKTWGVCTEESRDQRAEKVLKRLEIPPYLNKEEILQKLQALDVSVFENLQDLTDDVWKTLPIAVDTFTDEKDTRLSINRKPILIGVTSEEAKLFVEMSFPRKSGENGDSTWRNFFSEYLGEFYFYRPVREYIHEIIDKGGEDYPVYAYLFDYKTETRDDESFPVSVFKPWLGKFHGLDTMFFLGNCCENSRVMPNVTKEDIFVNETMATIVHKFMTQKVENIDLPRYRPESKIVSRISEAGATNDNYGYQHFDLSKESFVPIKLIFGALILKLFPNEF